jgi:predicted metalloprotease with PDZ domain
MPSALRSSLLIALFGCAGAAQAARTSPATATIDVDLSEAPRRLIHSRIVLPVRPGPMALFYPKWIPGEHGPTGPIDDLSGIVLRASGRTLAWQRDPVDMYKIALQIPEDARELEIALDYTSPPPGHGQFTSGASITQNLAILNWHTVLVYPAGTLPRDLIVRPSLRLPRGWRFGSALPGAARDGDRVQFSEVTLERLVDSPLLAGAHMTDLALGENHGAPVALSAAAETEEEAQFTPEEKGWLGQLVREEAVLFGARHFGSYRFLLALTDSVPANGIEHHESSDNRLGGRALVEKELVHAGLVHLLAHESAHSWNGKYRRPASLTTLDYQTPMKGDLLWVYEGLTQYLGTILTARSGSWDAATLRDYFAIVADAQRSHAGRRWRPLQDTATAAQILYGARNDWSALRRSVDFYEECDLIWLEVDARLRQASGGKSSLDDFVRRFHGGKDSGPQIVTYDFEEVVRTLEELSPGGGFRELLRTRLDSTGEDAPLEGLLRAGWRLDYTDVESELHKARDKERKRIDLRSSIGILVELEHETISDVIPGRPADKAGVMPGAKLVAVNGRKFSPERLVAAVGATKAGQKVELLIENAETFRSYALDYSGGLRYPHLVPVEGKPDLLSEIGKPRAK